MAVGGEHLRCVSPTCVDGRERAGKSIASLGALLDAFELRVTLQRWREVNCFAMINQSPTLRLRGRMRCLIEYRGRGSHEPAASHPRQSQGCLGGAWTTRCTAVQPGRRGRAQEHVVLSRGVFR